MDISTKILSDITVYMKYARYIPEKKRRETWKELVERNKQMHIKKYPELKSQIDNLKVSLKRPNEILVKYKELQNELDRNEQIYNDIEDNLITLKIERAKDKKTWDIISEPSIDKNRVSPKRKKNVLIAFVLSIIGTFLFSVLKEKQSKIIYELSEVKKIIDLDFKEVFEKDDYSFNKDYLSELKRENDFVILNTSNSTDENPLKGYLSDTFLSEDFKVCRELALKENKIILIFIEEGKLTRNDINNLNKYINLYKDLFIGWIYIKG